MNTHFDTHIDFERRIKYLEHRLNDFKNTPNDKISLEHLLGYLLKDLDDFGSAEEKCKYADRLEKLKKGVNNV